MKTYTSWGTKECPNTLVGGEEPPRFHDGTRMPDTEVLHAILKVRSWKRAVACHNALRDLNAKKRR